MEQTQDTQHVHTMELMRAVLHCWSCSHFHPEGETVYTRTSQDSTPLQEDREEGAGERERERDVGKDWEGETREGVGERGRSCRTVVENSKNAYNYVQTPQGM